MKKRLASSPWNLAWLAVLFILAFTSCRPKTSTPVLTATLGASPYATQRPSPTATSLPASPVATSVLFSSANGTANTDQPDNPLDTPVPDPLRFVFPTPAQAPVSAWRPPLYPTPWVPTPYDHFFFARPIAANEVNWPLADYRYGGEFFEDTIHTGVDIPAPKGTPVLAAGPGRVVWAGYGIYRGGYDTTDPYGLAVSIRHDFGYQGQPLYTIYGHLDQVDVTEGQYVETGAVLGLVGETGRVTGPHLHFEVRLAENTFYNTRNPELWTAPPIGWGVLAGRIVDSAGQLVNDQLIIATNPRNGQNWFARSYGEGAVNSDPYYNENLTIGDLPAGVYQLRAAYGGYSYSSEIEVFPGMVSSFTFHGFEGFIIKPPSPPGQDFSPFPTQTPSPTP
ncbi:MAG: peptidoglycan DD-metalloendopeptidase family protein [Anaerolineales bacterium]|nr:peptidoglycan DD-metalloendopeptidase family protein [Anaerolineales bacterium]